MKEVLRTRSLEIPEIPVLETEEIVDGKGARDSCKDDEYLNWEEQV